MSTKKRSKTPHRSSSAAAAEPPFLGSTPAPSRAAMPRSSSPELSTPAILARKKSRKALRMPTPMVMTPGSAVGKGFDTTVDEDEDEGGMEVDGNEDEEDNVRTKKGKGKAKEKKRKRKLVKEVASDQESDSDSDTEAAVSSPVQTRKKAPRPSTSTSTSADPEPEFETFEDPPLSHKERRKRRKLGLPDVDVDPAAPAATSASAPTTPATSNRLDALTNRSRSGFGVWVGNLSFNTTVESLRSFFEGCGEITRINMPGGKPGQTRALNRGFAYVDFASSDGVTIALTQSEHDLDGRKLLIKNATDFSGRPAPLPSSAPPASTSASTGDGGQEVNGSAAVDRLTRHVGGDEDGSGRPDSLSKTARRILGRQKHQEAPTLFFGNLSFEATEAGIRGMLEAHARSTLKWQKKDREMKRKAAKEKRRERKKRKREDLEGSESGSEEDGSDDESEAEAQEEEEGEKSESSGTEESDDGEAEDKPVAGIRKIRMGTFEDTGKCKGFAFVDFLKPSFATAALINPRNHTLDGRKLVVEYAGEDAIRRGGGAAAKKIIANGGGRPRPSYDRNQYDENVEEAFEEYQPRREPRKTFSKVGAGYENGKRKSFSKPGGGGGGEKQKRAAPGETGKVKSGAVLANAPRERTGIIVGAKGKRTVFE